MHVTLPPSRWIITAVLGLLALGGTLQVTGVLPLELGSMTSLAVGQPQTVSLTIIQPSNSSIGGIGAWKYVLGTDADFMSPGYGCAGSCPFPSGTTILLRAEPHTIYKQTGWGGPCQGAPTYVAGSISGVCKLTLYKNQTVTATFAPINSIGVATEQTVDLTTPPLSNGVIVNWNLTYANVQFWGYQSDCGGCQYPLGDVQALLVGPPGNCSGICHLANGSTKYLRAIPSAGYKQTGWGGGCQGAPLASSNTGPSYGLCILTMHQNQMVTATFAPINSVGAATAVTAPKN